MQPNRPSKKDFYKRKKRGKKIKKVKPIQLSFI